MKKKLLYWL